MLNVFLWINALAYAGLSILCVVRVRATAGSIGYTTLGSGGVSEFSTVYGGLQLGLALFFAYCALTPALQRIGLIFAICLYVPIALFRLVSVLTAGGSTVTWSLLALETALMIAALALWIVHRSGPVI